MNEAFVGIGSNVEPEKHVRMAVQLMRERFGTLKLSPVYRNRAVGFAGDDFLNLVVVFECDLRVDALNSALDAIELACGRERGAARFSPRTLDLDLLLYGARVDAALKLPRKEILKYDFVLRPLAELAPSHRHPETGLTYREHWEKFPAEKAGLTATTLSGL
jgi:2-amino-4-hydroxy-6-hydroxymethyldihydropteridine diphosphokinase